MLKIQVALMCLFLSVLSSGQELDKSKKYEVIGVGFYNLENLFDTINSEHVSDEEFTPTGSKEWNTEKYHHKLKNLEKVISDLGASSTPDGVAILGVCEIENRSVLSDLVSMPLLKERNYRIVHYDSPDHRGIDVGLLYNPRYFLLHSSKKLKLTLEGEPDFASRDMLLVSGDLRGDKFHFIVAHWPSRRGGEKKSSYKRIAAAQLAKRTMDSIAIAEPNARIVLMGDLNDDPNSPSVKDHVHGVGKMNKVGKEDCYNAMETHFKKGIGTLAWRDNWNLFDQMIMTPELINYEKGYSEFKFYKSFVYNKLYLKNKEGNFAGYPFRTFVGSNFQGGYSDHFPVYSLFVRESE